jgi:Arc/MetJ-type ribon-helix-helix transcriptional regulator
MLTSVATEQIAVRLPVPLLEELDRLVAAGVYESRAAAVRAGIETLAELQERRRIDEKLVEGYGRIPVTDAEMRSAYLSARASIAEEPW